MVIKLFRIHLYRQYAQYYFHYHRFFLYSVINKIMQKDFWIFNKLDDQLKQPRSSQFWNYLFPHAFIEHLVVLNICWWRLLWTKIFIKIPSAVSFNCQRHIATSSIKITCKYRERHSRKLEKTVKMPFRKFSWGCWHVLSLTFWITMFADGEKPVRMETDRQFRLYAEKKWWSIDK